MTSPRGRALRLLIGASLAATLLGAGLPAPALAAPTPRISFPEISFGQQAVDTTAGATRVKLNWTVGDTDASATQLQGTIQLRQFNGTEPVGPVTPIRFALTRTAPAKVYAASGDVRQSTYSYDFVVPRYGASPTATWQVTKITATDDRGTTRTLSANGLAPYQARLAVTQLVDTTAPAVDYLAPTWPQKDVVYAAEPEVALRYDLFVSDAESGFWKGRVILAGPGDARLTVPIEVVDDGDSYPRCGPEGDVYDPANVYCDLRVTLPAGSPTGRWSVARIVLTDAAGNTGTAAGVPEVPVTITRNDVLSATDFAISATSVDNWREEKTVLVSLKPSGARRGLTVSVVGSYCVPTTDTPTIGPDGTATIPVLFFSASNRCTISGIMLTDGAGHTAVYGSEYAAPELNLTVTRTPDPTPPVALTAKLSPDTVPTDNPINGIGVEITVDDATLAPINGFSTTVYDAQGSSVGGGSGGLSSSGVPNEVLRLPVYFRSLPPGTYTVGFSLTDAAGNSSHYGYPNGIHNPAPSGPLVLTVTPE